MSVEVRGDGRTGGNDGTTQGKLHWHLNLSVC